MESFSPQTMTFVLPTINATVTTASIRTLTTIVVTSSGYPYIDDPTPLPSLLPDVDGYQTHQKIAASNENATIAWWYEGISSVIPDSLPLV